MNDRRAPAEVGNSDSLITALNPLTLTTLMTLYRSDPTPCTASTSSGLMEAPASTPVAAPAECLKALGGKLQNAHAHLPHTMEAVQRDRCAYLAVPVQLRSTG